jgi:hypothetical protein
MKWLNKIDLWVNPTEEDPDKRVVFRQVGWQGHSGKFYVLGVDPSNSEKGGFSPIYIQIGPE